MTKKQATVTLRKAHFMAEVLGEPPELTGKLRQAINLVQSIQANPKKLLAPEQIRSANLPRPAGSMLLDIMERGSSKRFDVLNDRVPMGLFNIRRLNGITPFQIGILYREYKIGTIRELEEYCRNGKLNRNPAFGEGFSENMADSINEFSKIRSSHLLSKALTEGNRLLEHLGTSNDVIRLSLIGELRRIATAIRRVEILASAKHPVPVIDHFFSSNLVEKILERSEKSASVRLLTGIEARLRVVDDAVFPYMQHYLSTTFDYRFVLGARAELLGFKLTDRGLFKNGEPLECRDEKEIYQNLGLSFIPPEARNAIDEIAIAESGNPIELVEMSDLKGLLHMHSDYSDGTERIEVMARYAEKMGLEYIGLTDHSQSSVYANGLDVRRVEQQHREIDVLNRSLGNITILKGIEVDVLEDGTLDFPDEILRLFDFVIASVHTHYEQDVKTMTRRIVRALENPYVDILGHMTGRLLLKHDGYQVLHKVVIDAAAEHGKVIELNSNPQRLDVDWRYLRYMRKQGVLTSINPDAHVSRRLHDAQYGILMARKGMLTRAHVLNCLGLDEVLSYFRRRRT